MKCGFDSYSGPSGAKQAPRSSRGSILRSTLSTSKKVVRVMRYKSRRKREWVRRVKREMRAEMNKK